MARQIIELMDDMHLSSQTSFMNYYIAMQSNDIASADTILQSDSSLDNQITTADNVNKLISRVNSRELQPKIDIDYFLAGLQALFERMIFNTRIMGQWSPDIEYQMHNFVYYQNKSYFVYTNDNPPKGTLPTDTSYWLEYDIRGLQGYGGFTNLNFLGNWDNTVNYNPLDVVIYQNKLWMANAQNVNYAPNLNHYPWSLIMVPEPANKTPIQKLEPTTGYSVGDFWFKITEGDDIIQTSWEIKTPQTTPRLSSASFRINDNIYVVGGQGRSLAPTDLNEVYDTITNTWSQKANYPTLIHGAGGFALNNKGYCVGGLNINNIPTNKCYSYDIETNTWTESTNFPILMAYMSTVPIVNNEAYLGGFISVTGISGEVYKFTPSNETWTKVTEMPVSRYASSAGAIGNKIYFIGGGDLTSNSFSNNQIYDIGTNTWSTGAELPTPRSFTGTFVHKNNIYVIGGLDALQYSTNKNEVYDSEENTWKEDIPMTYKRNSFASQYTSSKGYAIGGINISQADISGYVEEFTFEKENSTFEMVINTNMTNNIITEDDNDILTEDDNNIIKENTGDISSDLTISIPMVENGNYDYWIDWGDGITSTQITTYNDEAATHTYAAKGRYTIKLNGSLDRLVFTGNIANDIEKVTKCELNLASIDNMFKNCIHLNAITDSIFSNSLSLSSANNVFEGCTALQVIPLGLFSNNPNITSFVGTFKNSGIISIPTNLFSGNNSAVDFTETFNGCYALTSIPLNLFAGNSSVSSFVSTFANCINLSNIPNNLFTNNPVVESYMGLFEGCSSITALPSLLFSTASATATNFSNIFKGNGLTVIPSGIFEYASNAENYNGAFEGNNITIIPENCFNGNNASWNSAFDINAITTLGDNSLNGLNITNNMFQGGNLVTVGNNVFWNNTVETLPSNPTYLFSNCRSLTKVGNINLKGVPSNVSLNNMFDKCTALTTIEGFMYNEGQPSLHSDISFIDCPLTYESLINISNSLVTNTPTTVRTLILGSNNLNLLSETEKLTIINKYWNLPGYTPTIDSKLAADLVLSLKGNDNVESTMFQETSLYYYVKLTDKTLGTSTYYAVDKAKGYVFNYNNIPENEYFISIESTQDENNQDKQSYWIPKGENDDTDGTILRNQLKQLDNITTLQIGVNPDDLPGISNTSLDNVSDLSGLCENLTTLQEANIYGGQKSIATNMSNMFKGCNKLTTLNAPTLNTSHVTNMSNLFSGCSSLSNLTTIEKWNNSNVTDMSNMFADCSSLTKMFNIKMPKVSIASNMYANTGIAEIKGNLLSSSIIDASYMFKNCKKLSTAPSDYTTIFGTNSNLTNVEGLFYGCSKYNKAGQQPMDVKQQEGHYEYTFNETKTQNQILAKCPNVTNASYMFYGSGITDLPVGVFYNNPKLTDISYAFANTLSLNTFIGGEEVGADEAYSNFLKNNVSLTTIEGLFQKSSINAIGQDTYANLANLENASYLYDSSGIDDINQTIAFPTGSPKLKDISYAFRKTENSNISLWAIPAWASNESATTFPVLEKCEGLFYNQTLMGLTHTDRTALPFINSITTLSTFESGKGAFYNCTRLSDYGDIPDIWKEEISE